MDESPTSEFVSERWEFTPGGEDRVSLKAVHDDFKAWMQARGQHARRPQELAQALRDKGWMSKLSAGRPYWIGVRARPAQAPSGGHGGHLYIDSKTKAPRVEINREMPTMPTVKGLTPPFSFTGPTPPDPILTDPRRPDHPDRLRAGVAQVRREWCELAATLAEPDRGEVLRAVVKLDWIPPGVDPRRHALDVLDSIPITPES